MSSVRSKLNASRSNKASKPTIGKGLPPNSYGNDGDLSLRMIGSDIKLLIKGMGKWHGVKVGESFDKLEMDVGDLKKNSIDVHKGVDSFHAYNRIISQTSDLKDFGAKTEPSTSPSGHGSLYVKNDILKFVSDVPTTYTLSHTTVGGNIMNLANPGAVTFLKMNADNTVTARSAADFRGDIGAGTSNVTALNDLSDVTYSSNDLTISGIDTFISGAITFDSSGDITLDADGDQIIMKWGGATGQIDFTNENSGDGVIQQKVTSKDLVIKQNDGDEIARFTDAGDVKVTNIVYFAAETANICDSSGGAAIVSIDWNVSQKQKVTITGTSNTINFTNPPGACNLMLKVIQGDGADTASWDGDIKWAGGAAPTLSSANGDIDILSFYWDGTNYFGVISHNFD